ncbi:MAG TPA: serine hydrolase domain-containing protein, partial [Thermoanaerobaculia bacterium]|nr:serine hydrolase domain-containing protein [Thermoanaerobaculia bacterium]
MKLRPVLVFALTMPLAPSLPAQPPAAPVSRQAASPLASTTIRPDGPPTWDKVTGVVDAMVAARGLDGAFLEVVRGDEVLYSRGFGRFTRDTLLNVASATKWVTATLLMTTVERDGVDLDGRIDRYLPWIPPDKAGVTLAQLLSHTSGLPGIRDNPIDLRQGVAMQLEEAARQIAALDLAHPPGAMFDYGGAGFQLSGAVAQAVTGKRWEELFQERIARPLGMTSSRYGHPAPELESAVGIQNPNLQAGLFTNAADYL